MYLSLIVRIYYCLLWNCRLFTLCFCSPTLSLWLLGLHTRACQPHYMLSASPVLSQFTSSFTYLGGAVTSVRWQITLCDPIDKWPPVVLRWISLRTIRSFTFLVIFIIITTLSIHHSSTLSLRAQNIPFQQILPTLIGFWYPSRLSSRIIGLIILIGLLLVRFFG